MGPAWWPLPCVVEPDSGADSRESGADDEGVPVGHGAAVNAAFKAASPRLVASAAAGTTDAKRT